MKNFIKNLKKHLILLDELRRFLRIEVALVIVCMTLSGYLLFHSIEKEMIPLILTAFFLSCASYSFNHFTDKEEDIVNNKVLNFFVIHWSGKYITLSFTVLTVLSLFYLPFLSFLTCVIALVLSMVYSAGRIKNIFPFKNIYSGFVMSMSFLMGCGVSWSGFLQGLGYFPLIFIIGMTGNLLGDIRGYPGDKYAKIKTIPVVLGVEYAKKLVIFNFILFTALVILLGYYLLLPILPSLIFVCIFMMKDEHLKARASMISSFLVLAPFLFLIKFIGG